LSFTTQKSVFSQPFFRVPEKRAEKVLHLLLELKIPYSPVSEDHTIFLNAKFTFEMIIVF